MISISFVANSVGFSGNENKSVKKANGTFNFSFIKSTIPVAPSNKNVPVSLNHVVTPSNAAMTFLLTKSYAPVNPSTTKSFASPKKPDMPCHISFSLPSTHAPALS